jgi:drug/metabolite transporter (DMT)-like permease
MMIRRGAVSRISTFLYLVPALVAIEAWILFGEALTSLQILGMAVTILGVVLASRK